MKAFDKFNTAYLIILTVLLIVKSVDIMFGSGNNFWSILLTISMGFTYLLLLGINIKKWREQRKEKKHKPYGLTEKGKEEIAKYRKPKEK